VDMEAINTVVRWRLKKDLEDANRP